MSSCNCGLSGGKIIRGEKFKGLRGLGVGGVIYVYIKITKKLR